MVTVPIEENASGNRTIAAIGSSRVFAVYGFWIKADAVVSITWKSSTATSISGVIPMSAGEVISAFGNEPVLKGRAKGDDIVLNLSGAVAVHGWVNYVEQLQ